MGKPLRFELAGVREAGVLFGVSRATADKLKSMRGFPAPAFCPHGGTYWAVTDLVAWAKSTGREYDLERYRAYMREREADTREALRLEPLDGQPRRRQTRTRR